MFSFVTHPLIVWQVFPNHRQDKKNTSDKSTCNSNLHKQVVILMREFSDYKFQGQIQDFEKKGALVIPVEKQMGGFKGRYMLSKWGLGKSPRSFGYSGVYQYKKSQYLCRNSFRLCLFT